MKYIYSFIIGLTALFLHAQSNNFIEHSAIIINGISFPQSETSLTSLLGAPTTIGTYYSEIDNETWVDYKYSDNSYYFFDNKLIEFELRNNSHYFQYPTIKVGSTISVINTYFPLSYTNRKISNNLGFISIHIIDGGQETDSFIVINYNKVTNLITSIHTGSY